MRSQRAVRTSPRVATTLVAVAAAVLATTAVTDVASGAAPSQPSRTASTSTQQDGAKGVVIDDIMIDAPYGPDVPAYVVRPTGKQAPGSDAGILFLHWLGELHSDRT